MVVSKISTQDINRIGTGGVLVATLPSLEACISVKQLVSYAKAVYPRTDGMTYSTSINRNTNTITISTK